MGNYFRLLDGELHERSSEAYVDCALSQVPDGTNTIGLITDHAPESLKELQAQVAERRVSAGEEGAEVSEEVDKFVMLIAHDPHPDEIVSRLPYDTEPPAGIWFVLPIIDEVEE